MEECSADLPENSSFPGEKHHPKRSKKVETLFGPIPIRRDYFYCPATSHGRLPLDQALGLFDSSSPGLVRLASRAAARSGYQAASQDLEALAGIKIDSRQIQRIVQQSGPIIGQQLIQGSCAIEKPIEIMYVEVDGTGVPMMSEELVGRKGKQPDGSSKTREVKLGCVFTQTTTDEEGNPLRDYQSTTYMGSFESAKSFGLKIRNEAQRRGIGSARVVVFLGDGAAWVWELVRLNFHGAVYILDFYHALERLNDLCKSLYPGNQHWISTMQGQYYDKMENDGIKDVILSARRRLRELDSAIQLDIEKQIAYFENNKERMLYKTFRQKGFYYGSGVVEAGCKTVVGQRLKQSGMFWSEQGGQNVLDLRCALLGNRWDECWDRVNHSDYLQVKAIA